MRWSLIQQVTREGSRGLVLLLLARLLEPSAFGLVAIAASWRAVLSLFSDLGFGPALIQRPNASTRDFDAVFVLNVISGVVLTASSVALAGPIARGLGSPEAEAVIVVMSASFLIDSISLTQSALAQRELRFKDLAFRDLGSSIGSGAVAIALAYAGWGVWALVAQSILSSAVSSIWLWTVTPWRPDVRRVELSRLRAMWAFSHSMFAFNGIKVGVQQADKFLVGFLLGPAAVGIYTVGFRLLVHPPRVLLAGISSYLFPRLSSIQADEDRVWHQFEQVHKAIAFAILPAAAMAALVGPKAIDVVLGAQWTAIRPLFPWLAMMAACQVLMAPGGEFLKALDRPGWLRDWSIAYGALVLLSIVLGSRDGLVGVCRGIALANAAGLLVSLWMSRKLLRTTSAAIIKPIMPWACLTLLVVIPLAWLASLATVYGPLPSVGLLLVAVTLYLVLAGKMDPKLYPSILAPLLGRRVGL